MTTVTAGLEADDGPVDVEVARQAFETLIKAIVAQPAAAKMCFVEVYAAGPEGVALVDRTLDSFEVAVKRLLDSVPGHEGMPAEIVRALIGGVQKVIHKRLYRGEEKELTELAPQLWDWIFCYPPPPGPLKVPRRRALKRAALRGAPGGLQPAGAAAAGAGGGGRGKGLPRDDGGGDRRAGKDLAANLLRTLRESGRGDGRRAGQRLGADAGERRCRPSAAPRTGSTRCATPRRRCSRFGVGEPEYARLGAVEMYAAGKRALEQRESVTEMMEGLLAPGYELNPDVPPITAEAIGGALYALFYDHVKQKGAERLAEMVPAAVYVTLAPFLGAEEAYGLAVGENGKG